MADWCFCKDCYGNGEGDLVLLFPCPSLSLLPPLATPDLLPKFYSSLTVVILLEKCDDLY